MVTVSPLKPNITYDKLCSEAPSISVSKQNFRRRIDRKFAAAAASEEPTANYSNVQGGRVALNNQKRHHQYQIGENARYLIR